MAISGDLTVSSITSERSAPSRLLWNRPGHKRADAGSPPAYRTVPTDAYDPFGWSARFWTDPDV